MVSVPFPRSQPSSAEPDPQSNAKQTAPAWLKPTFLYKQRAQVGAGVLSAGCASLLLRHPGGPLHPALSTPRGSSRGSLEPPALAPSPDDARIWQLLVGFAFLLPASLSARCTLLFIKLYRETLAGSIPACLSLLGSSCWRGDGCATDVPRAGHRGDMSHESPCPPRCSDTLKPVPAWLPAPQAAACSGTPRGAVGGHPG